MENSSDIKYLSALYKDYYDGFLRYAKSYVSTYDIAEDIVLESLMGYWENRSTLSHTTSAPVYILTSIKNKCLNHLRSLHKQREIEEYLIQKDNWELNLKITTLEACNPEKLFSEEVRSIINETLDSLPKQTRDIFIRSRFKEESHKKIAADTGLSTKSIEYHITKSLKILRKALKDYFPLFLAIFQKLI